MSKQNLRFFFALWTAKAAEKALNLIGRPASFMPGKIAIKLCPDFLGRIGRPKTVACVTGTNGKTTTCNLLINALEHNGYKLTCNAYGSNVAAGVASAFITGNTITGKSKNDLAILEVDERSSLLIYPYIKPDYVLCTCLCRDSVKRNANTDFISYVISKALPEETTLILNGDDVICSGIGSEKNPRIHFGMTSDYGQTIKKADDYGESLYCPNCGAPLKNEFLRYDHIGRMYCGKCDFKSPECDCVVSDVNIENQTITYVREGNEYNFKLVSDNIVNIYNQAASITLLFQLGLSYEQIASYYESAKIVASRFDTLKFGDTNIVLQLAKGLNPVACTRSIDYVCHNGTKKKNIIVFLDDVHDNCNNTENICWIYDVDYAPFTDPSVNRLIFAGPRSQDHKVRALISGVDPSKVFNVDGIMETLDLIETEGVDYCLLYELYRVDEAQELKSALIKKLGLREG